MDTLLGLLIGIGLSAACGFRVFVPLLGLSIASLSGHLTLSPGFQWIGSWPALAAFSTATILEIGAYYIPWFDHLMDTITTPAAIVAGILVTASLVSEMTPFLKWSFAIIAGGGAAGIIQTGTVLARTASSGTTGGFTNFLVATGESVGSILTTILVLLIPVIGLVVVGIFLFLIIRSVRRLKHKPA